MKRPEKTEVYHTRGELIDELLGNALKVPPERLERLSSIARLVGGDWGMKVEVGEPGTGSVFQEDKNTIRFDPLHIADTERARLAEFVAAHEGGHRAITRGPLAIGLRRQKALELFMKLGFAFGRNMAEDPSDNNWWSVKYPGLELQMRETYDKWFQDKDAVLTTPHVDPLIARLGYIPRFVRFGSEFMRFWHTGEFSGNIPEEMRDALERVREPLQLYFEDLPSEHPSEDEVIEHARSRFTTYLERIWPEMESLVREDLADERIRQMIEEGLKGEQKAGEDEGEGEGGISIPLDQLPDDLRQELRDKMKGAAGAAADKTEEAAEKQAGELEKDIQSLREAARRLRKEAEDKGPEEKAAAEAAALELEKRAEELEAKAGEIRDKARVGAKDLRHGRVPQPVPIGELSDELRRELEKLFRELNPEDRRKLEEAARQELETIEDKLNSELEGKLDPTKPESHAERHEREEKEAKERERERKKEAREREERKEIERALEAEKTAYDRAYADVAPLINLLADDIDRLFLPERHPRWRGHFPVGGRLSLQKAMQFEARPELYTELWERKTIPTKKDFKFTLLVDLSGSMRESGKIEQTFKGVILLSEALSRAGIDVEILGFQDELIEFKSYEERMDDAVRSRISGMPDEVFNLNPGGHNRADYNDDGYVVKKAADRLSKQSGRDKFLIVLSDGLPAPSPAHAGKKWDLKKIVQQIRREKIVRMLGVGLGPGTEHVREFYPNSVVVENVPKFPRALAALFEDIIKNPETY